MSKRIEDELAKLGEQHEPPEDHMAKILDSIKQDDKRRARHGDLGHLMHEPEQVLIPTYTGIINVTPEILTDQQIKSASINKVARLEDCIVAIGLKSAPPGELIQHSRQRVCDAINKAEYFRIFYRTPLM